MKEFTKNDCLEMMYGNTANTLKEIAKHIKETEMTPEEIIDFLNELAEEMEAQIVVVKLRDDILKL